MRARLRWRRRALRCSRVSVGRKGEILRLSEAQCEHNRFDGDAGFSMKIKCCRIYVGRKLMSEK